MSGEIIFEIRKGIPTSDYFKTIGWYPERYLKIRGEEQPQIEITISPTIKEIEFLIKTILMYEKLHLYDFYKITQTKEGSLRTRFQNIINDLDKMDISEFRNKIIENCPVYKETLKRKNNDPRKTIYNEMPKKKEDLTEW